MKAAVNDVQAVRDAAITGEGEHHAGVGSLEFIRGAIASPNWDWK